MSQLFAHRLGGVVPLTAGSAVAALRARAAAYGVSILETPERMTLALWGGELRLEPASDALRLDLHAPEARLIGLMQDMASEALAEAGIEIMWERVDTGALAPNLSLMRVASVRPLSPRFQRLRLQGPEAERFGRDGLHVRLLLPQPGRMARWPRIGPTGRTVWPEGPDALHRPVYTVADQQADWLDIDIFCHAGSPTCDWACADPSGDEVGVMGPGGGWCPEAQHLLLLGDQTALPAIRRMLALAGPRARAHVLADRDDLGALARDPRVSVTTDLLAALEAEAPGPDSYVWFAAHAAQARDARAALLARGHPKTGFTAAAYWT